MVVVDDGAIIAEKGYGFADLANRQPVDPRRTLFRIGSISKLFTWTAVMQQVEAGRLDLDQDVNAYLDFRIPPYEGKPLTLRDIMTHTPGFEESLRYLFTTDPAALLPLDEYAKRALPHQVYAPGTTPAYSNYATALAGYIVQRVSGQPYDTYVENHILDPVGMNFATSRQPLPAKLAPYMSKGYRDWNEAPRPFEIVQPAPAGSFSVSGEAMGKFMIAHLQNSGVLFDPATGTQMHDYRAKGVGPLNRMALGFYEQVINGRRSIGHGGDTDYFHSEVWLFPESGIGLFIATNSRGKEAAAYGLRGTIIHEFADRYFPEQRKFTPIDPAVSRQHAQLVAGTYVSSRGSFTNFMSVFGLLGPTKIIALPDGGISLPDLSILSAGPRDWVEVEPFVWRDTFSGERVAAEVKDGNVVRVSMDVVSPFMVLFPAPAAANPAWLLPALLIALAFCFLAVVAWPVRALVRRHFGAPFALSGRSLTAYRLSRVFAGLAILAVLGWLLLVQTFTADSGTLGGDLDWLINLLRILTPLAAFGLLVTAAWHLANSFRDGRRWTMKLGAVLLVFAGVILCWVTIAYNLYGFEMTF
nr:serine hydrolase domain-containing protein [Croceibacterium sp. D39]